MLNKPIFANLGPPTGWNISLVPLWQQQQQVEIAVNSPAILLADKPTGNRDGEDSAAVLKLIKDLNRRLGQTILRITHDTDSTSYADRIVTMRMGV